MNKRDDAKSKYCLQWENHPKITFKNVCSLMEHQSLVDIAICCGNNTLHAHKCVLAASSPYFREELEKNSSIEQVLIVGFDFSVLKSIIEFIYCGETIVAEEHFKYMIAAAKLFQLRGLEALFSDRQDYQNQDYQYPQWKKNADEIFIPPPQFLTKKPKYPSALHPFGNAPNTSSNIPKPINYSLNDPYNQRRFKRKYIRAEAEKACAKEAQASRMALANLQKEIASTPQVNSFIIEESCTETTVENFIPHSEDNFVENLNGLHQVVNYGNVEGSPTDTKPPNMLEFSVPSSNHPMQDLTADKIKHMLGDAVQSNVEIMFKTSEGNFVSVTDDVLQNLSKGGISIQYQVVDENGDLGEIRDLHLLGRPHPEKVENIQADAASDSTMDIEDDTPEFVTTQEDGKIISDHFISDSYLKTTKELVNNTDSASAQVRTSTEERNPLESLNDSVYENSFTIFGSRSQSNENGYDEQPIEIVPIPSESYMCSNEDNSNSDRLSNPIGSFPANNYYNLGDFMSSITNGTTNLETNTIDGKRTSDDENVLEEMPNKKPKSGLKFSPDIFFADLPNGNVTSATVNENVEDSMKTD